MDIQIIHNQSITDIDKIISLDFINNRYDLLREDYYIFSFHVKGEMCALTGYLEREILYLGIWLVPIEEDILKNIIIEIFSRFWWVRQIKYQHSYYPIGHVFFKGNHFKILLPETVGELQSRLSSKHRYNLRRELHIIENEVGPVEYLEYETDIPDEVVYFYFRHKSETYKFDCSMTPEQFLRSSGISNVYVIKAGGVILSILLSCEKSAIIYLENLTYDSSFSRYSVGQVLYNHYLERLVEKGKSILFLSGGNYAYKRRYGSIEDVTYDGIVFRNNLWFLCYKWLLNCRHYKSRLLSKIIKIVKSI